jgi:cytochrome c556
MTKLHKGGNAQFKKLETATKTKPTDWTSLKKSTAEFAVLAGALGKNQPPKGDKASWTKQTDTYFESAKEMEKAAEAEDLATLEATEKKIGASCKACHNVHRGR